MPRYSYQARIKAQLNDLGKTQKDLSSAIGYSPQYLSKVLRGDIYAPQAREKIHTTLIRWKEEKYG